MTVIVTLGSSEQAGQIVNLTPLSAPSSGSGTPAKLSASDPR